MAKIRIPPVLRPSVGGEREVLVPFVKAIVPEVDAAAALGQGDSLDQRRLRRAGPPLSPAEPAGERQRRDQHRRGDASSHSGDHAS